MYDALGFTTKNGNHKVLPVNKRDGDSQITLPHQTAKSERPTREPLQSETVTLRGLSVTDGRFGIGSELRQLMS